MRVHLSKHLLYPVLAGALLLAQGPVNDVVTVTFPNDVQVGSRVLRAGDYTIRQLTTSSNPRILEFSTDKGTAIQATATAFAALDNNNRKDTSVELESQGGVQHIYRIWLKGKSYGYEFPIESSQTTTSSTATSGEKLSLTATYTPAAEAPVPTPQVAENVPPRPTPEPAPEPVAQAQVTPPAPIPDPQPVVSPAPAPEPAPAPQAAATATEATDSALPSTASYGPILFASGLGLLLTAWATAFRS